MKNLLFTIVLMFCTFSIGQNFENNFKKDVLNLLKADKDKSEIFLNSMTVISQNFYKNIQSEFLRNKYIKELDTDLKMDLKELYLEKKAMVGDLEKLFNEANSRGFVGEYDSAIAFLSTFYDKWYESQLQSLEYFSDFALIFDYCEFDYNPGSTSQMFTFYTQKCLDNYNSKISKMTQQLNYDENLKTELKSIFTGIIDFTEPNKVVEPEMNTDKVELEKLRKEYETDIQQMINQLQSKVKQYDAEAPYQTDEENQKRLEEVQAMEQSIEQYQQQAMSDYQKKESDLLKPKVTVSENMAERYFNSGYEKYEENDYYGAISDFTKAVELEPEDYMCYFYLGLCKFNLKLYSEAIIDLDKSIQLKPNPLSFYIRGYSKARLNNHQEAIIDLDKSIEFETNNAAIYYVRGVSKAVEKDLIGACNDWKKALSLGDKRATSVISDYCN